MLKFPRQFSVMKRGAKDMCRTSFSISLTEFSACSAFSEQARKITCLAAPGSTARARTDAGAAVDSFFMSLPLRFTSRCGRTGARVGRPTIGLRFCSRHFCIPRPPTLRVSVVCSAPNVRQSIRFYRGDAPDGSRRLIYRERETEQKTSLLSLRAFNSYLSGFLRASGLSST